MSGRRRSAGSWIEGARAAGADLGHPGERLGLPREGAGSVAGYGRRLGALVIDWLIALLVATALAGALHWSAQARSLLTLGVFGVLAWLLTGLIGTTAGKALCGLRVVRTDGRPLGPLWAFVRALLLVLVVPALIWDRDHRGLHDRAAGGVVVRR
jgi:uncharacterized RDD family membrane protein YckC